MPAFPTPSIGGLHAALEGAAAGGFVAGSRVLGFASCVNSAAGTYTATLAAGYAIDTADAALVCTAETQGFIVAATMLTDTTIGIRSITDAGAASNVAFHLLVFRKAIS